MSTLSSPATVQAVTKTSNEDGSSSRAYADGAVIWGIVEIQENETNFIFNYKVTLPVGATIKLDGKRYRVLTVTRLPGQPKKSATIEILKRPIDS